ncbi:lysophospholipid acyltransferase family protein [Cytophagaceae bacterium ABcell3]|nr:lysophospholipid acyltransferase family protein [Cytophagaceae bacterium ABcell3]
MIKAKQNPLAVAFFKKYFAWQIKKHFSCVKILGNINIDSNKPILLLGNHYSWWDGPLMFYLNNKVFKKRFYVMMLEETLSKNKILSQAGAFSIKRQSRGVVESLQYAAGLLKNSKNLLCLYPQGEFESQYKDNLKFHTGFTKVVNADTEIIFATVLTEYYSRKKPQAYIYLKKHQGEYTPEDLEKAFQEHHLASKNAERPPF